MTPIFFLPKLFLAGGAFLGALQLPSDTPLDNHTLAGDRIPAAQVVTRSHWGTPMLPDGKGGYSLIAPIDKKLIEQSLWIPPVVGTRPVVETPLPTEAQPALTAPVPAPVIPAPVATPVPTTQ